MVLRADNQGESEEKRGETREHTPKERKTRDVMNTGVNLELCLSFEDKERSSRVKIDLLPSKGTGNSLGALEPKKGALNTPLNEVLSTESS